MFLQATDMFNLCFSYMSHQHYYSTYLTDMLKLYIFLCLDFHNCATWLRWGKDHILPSKPGFVDHSQPENVHSSCWKTSGFMYKMFKCGQQCSLVWQPSLPPPDMKVRSYTCHLDKLWPAVVMFLRYETQVQVLETHKSDRAAVDITLNNFFRQISICHWYRELFCTRWCGISFSIETRVYRLWLFSDWVGKYSFWCNLIAVS